MSCLVSTYSCCWLCCVQDGTAAEDASEVAVTAKQPRKWWPSWLRLAWLWPRAAAPSVQDDNKADPQPV